MGITLPGDLHSKLSDDKQKLPNKNLVCGCLGVNVYMKKDGYKNLKILVEHP